jgi:hypothetical protein
MQTKFKTFTLFDLCGNYIDNCYTLEGIKTANKDIYNLCSFYLLTDNCPDSVREKLTKFFNLDNH